MKLQLFRKRGFTSGELIIAVALFVTVTANTTLFAAARNAFGTAALMWPFYISLFASLLSLLILVLSALCHRALVKPMLIAFLLLSAGLAYFSDRYGTIFDTQMIANAIETDSAEARDLFNPKMLLWIGLLGLLPSIAVWRAKLCFPDWMSETIARLKLAGAAVACITASGLAFSGHYAALMREHRDVTSKAIPSYALLSAVRYALNARPAVAQAHVVIGQDAQRPADEPHRELVIMVVGETARADHWGLNGYSRDTTPSLRQANVVNFPNFWSCGTSTAHSVPCMFSNVGRKNFDQSSAAATDNALDVLARSGVSVLWRDNNSSSKGVADRVPYQNYRTSALNPMCQDGECRDEGMLDGLQAHIDAQKGDILIVLHQMGNHGPAYYKRYPTQFERFTPTCQSNDLGSCTSEQIINTYDNALLYTDYFLSKVIDLLKKNDPNFETAMFYVSDHGESLGEYGVYLHGAPYALAPDAQKHVPAVAWFGERMKQDIVVQTLEERSRRQWSHDNLFATLLGLFETRSEVYNPAMDLLEHTADEIHAKN